MDGTILLDATAQPDGGWHPIAALGQYSDRRYGKFSITEKDYEAWKRNLEQHQGGEVAIDRDHVAAAPRGSTRAAGWIKDLKVGPGVGRDGKPVDQVFAQVEFTPEGAQDVRDRYYKFVSPEFTEHYKTEDGRDVGKALVGLALTNRPFLRRGLPALNLSALPDAEFEEAVELAAKKKPTGNDWDDAEDAADGGRDEAAEGENEGKEKETDCDSCGAKKIKPKAGGKCPECGDAANTLADEHMARLLAMYLDRELVPNKPGASNWVERAGGLPGPIADLAGDLIGKHDTSSAIAIAVEGAKRFCAMGKAKWCAAVAKWEEMKASAHAADDLQVAIALTADGPIQPTPTPGGEPVPLPIPADGDVGSRSADTRLQMGDLANIAKKLGLDEEADEAKVLAAIDELPEQATKTLDERAKEDGKVLLSQETFDEMRSGVAAGVSASKTLAEQRFTTAFADAVREGRIAPAQEEQLKELYDGGNQDAIVKLLEDSPAVVPTEARGKAGTEEVKDGDEVHGVPGAEGLAADGDTVRITKLTQKIAAEQKIPFHEAAKLAIEQMETQTA